MAFSTIAFPGQSGQQRRNKSVSLDGSGYGGNTGWSGTIDNVNMLHQVYRGRYDRLERYRLFDLMDTDSDIARALDIIAEHCTDRNGDGDFFNVNWLVEDTTDEYAGMLKDNLRHWSRINQWRRRLFRNVRNVIKYGDWFYFRNPNTFELYSLHPKLVLAGLVDRETNEVVAWVIRNFKFNVDGLEVAVDSKNLADSLKNIAPNTGIGIRNTKVIPATHIIHLTTSEGKLAGTTADDDPMDRYTNRWPFGESFLNQIYKTYKQRDLLEDAILIHRVQRAPTRNVWYIDTGKMRADRASWTVENFKNELNQKRIPQFIGQNPGSERSVDSVYNPISQLEDYYIPVSMDQRGSKVETLEGQSWDSIPELDYFKKKIMASLRVPYAWMLGSQEGGSVFNDGRAGVAYQEEIEFSRFCSRFQENIIESFDWEFKLYCEYRDVELNDGDFELELVPPDNYEESKRLARQNEAISVWSAVKDEAYISKRFALKEFGLLTDDKILENERMLLEERQDQAADEVGGGLGNGGGFGALPPPGPGGAAMPGSGLGAPMAGPGSGDMGAIPGDAGAGMAGLGAGGVGAGAGGFGESRMAKKKIKLDEANLKNSALTMGDIETPEPTGSDYNPNRTPDDNLFMNFDPVNPQEITTLKQLQKIRLIHMSQRVNNMKRMKILKKVYGTGTPGAGTPGGGLF